jgi:hypothetical protein
MGVSDFKRALNDPLGLVNATVALSEDARMIFPYVDTLLKGDFAFFHGKTPMIFLARSSKYTTAVSPMAKR